MHLGLNVTASDGQTIIGPMSTVGFEPRNRHGFRGAVFKASFQALVSVSWFSGVIANATF
ncbi:hypothetical protein M2418_001913 [Rhizobium sp. BIGb0125]|jgi:hypothetical protein|nr:hypothetical protein [Rhizobium sp. BIGb0125]